MFATKHIKECIEKVITSPNCTRGGYAKFIVYPFGENGFQIKQVLKEYFGIDPYMIIDNKWSKYNTNIASTDELRRSDVDDAYILLGVEDDLLNKRMYEELSEIFSEDRIINFKTPYDSDLQRASETYKKLNIRNLFPDADFLTKDLRDKSQKINLIFYIKYAASSWGGIKSLYDCFIKDDKYHVVVVPASTADSGTLHMRENVKRLQKDRVEMVDEDNLLEYLNPDVVIVTGYAPMMEICSMAGARILGGAKLSIGIYNRLLDVGVIEDGQHIERNMNRGSMALCDYCIADASLYRLISKDALEMQKGKYVELGHPKFDNVWGALHKNDCPSTWKKLKGKKVVLWAPVHGLNGDGIGWWWYTFDIYAKYIINYAIQHKEIGLIIRLQNVLVWELLELGIWKYKELEVIRKYCEECPNIVFDENSSYANAYSIMDGVITDSLASVEHTALPTLKPICITHRDSAIDKSEDARMPLLQRYEDILYNAYSIEDIDTFFGYIASGKDPMLGIRREKMGDYVKSCDGKNAQRIKDFIEKKYFDMVE